MRPSDKITGAAAILAVTAAAMVVGSTAQAAIIVETGTISNFTVETSGDTNVRQFDPALGTLTGATVRRPASA